MKKIPILALLASLRALAFADIGFDLGAEVGCGKNGFGGEPTTYCNIDFEGEMSELRSLFSYEKDADYGEVIIAADKDFKVYTLSHYGEVYIG